MVGWSENIPHVKLVAMVMSDEIVEQVLTVATS